jgi:cell division protein FtsZ
LPNVWFVALSADAAALAKARADLKFQLGPNVCGGMGTGADPTLGARAFEESENLVDTFKDRKALYCIVSGLGAGTGSGVAPLLAEAIKQRGHRLTAILTMPFHCEGKKRTGQAEASLGMFRSAVPFPVVVKNQDVFSLIDKGATLQEGFSLCDLIAIFALEQILALVMKNPLRTTTVPQESDYHRILADTLSFALADVERQLELN